MKNKGYTFIFLAVLLLSGVIVSPVCAYTVFSDYTLSNNTLKYNIGTDTPIYGNNVTQLLHYDQISKIEANAFCYYAGGANVPTTLTGSIATQLVPATTGTVKGNATFTWDWGSGNTGTYIPCSYTIEIQDYNCPYPTCAWWESVKMTAVDKAIWGGQDFGFMANTFSAGQMGIRLLNDYLPSGDYVFYTGSSVSTPEASFTCAPVSQFPDADVVCTDTSTNDPTDWYWTLDYDALGIKAWQTSTSRNFTWQSHYNGLFSVNLRANNSAGNSWYNRSEYVLISNNASPMTPETPIPAGYIRSKVQCVDSQNSATIQSCYISIQDKEAGTWSNGSWFGTYFIDTLPAHHIDAYGTATGYTDTSRLNLPASGSIMYELLMFPGYAPAAAAGNVWLYVLVNDMSTGAALPSAQVQISSSGLTSQTKLTGISGQASFEVANDTVWHVTASRSGYQTMAEVITTSHLGPDTLRIELPRTTVTPTVTGTVLPGEVTVRPTQDPALNPDGSYPSGYSAVKGQEMMNWLAENGFDLVQLCFLVTILGLLGVKLGK